MRIALLSVLCACGAAAIAAAAGCGDDGLPSDAAAKVGDTTISKTAVVGEAQRMGATGDPTAAQRAPALHQLIEAQWLKDAAGSSGGSVGAGELRRRMLARVKVTDADVVSYYATHRAEYGPPRRRVVFFLKVRTVAEASRAADGLRTGKSWVDTIDAARRQDPTISGDALPFVEHHFKDKAFGRAMFAAEPTTLVGPLRTRYGVYLVETSGETPWSPHPLAKDRPAIEAKARPWKLEQTLSQRYGGETRCADEYRLPSLPECA